MESPAPCTLQDGTEEAFVTILPGQIRVTGWRRASIGLQNLRHKQLSNGVADLRPRRVSFSPGPDGGYFERRDGRVAFIRETIALTEYQTSSGRLMVYSVPLKSLTALARESFQGFACGFRL
jgi:hypothetical protein